MRKLRVIVREDRTGTWGAPLTTYKTFDIPMTADLLVHLDKREERRPDDIERVVAGAELVEE